MLEELRASKAEQSALLKPWQEKEETKSLLARESTVLLGGFADGGKRGISKSLSDLSGFAGGMLESPVSTLSEFGKNHWQEAGLAAALSFLTPRGVAATIIAAVSLKDPVLSTLEAAKSAANPSKSLTETKEKYANEISGQTQAIVNGLPMTLLGAGAGRVSANMLFGKNMSALDLINGKLELHDLRANMLKTADQIRRPEVKLIVTDMDNTLLSTHKQQALGLEKAVKDLSGKTGISQPELYASLGKVMEHYHSHSYPWTLELALKDRLKIGEAGGMPVAKFNKEIADPFWKTMDDSLQDLSLYPGVRETLAKIADKNIPVVVLSDASASSGLRRFTYLKLDQAPIERLYTLRNPAEPANMPEILLEGGRARLKDALSTKHSLKEFNVLPREWEKPAAGGLNAIMQKYEVRPSQVLMIGDSVKRDMGVAAATGARGLHAKYNEAHPEYDAILSRFKDGSGKARTKATEKQVPFEAGLASYGELTGYLPAKWQLNAIPGILKQNNGFYLVPPLVLSQSGSER